MRTPVLVLAFLLASCGDSPVGMTPTTTTPPTATTSAPVGSVPLPRVDQAIDILNVRGYSWFAGTMNDRARVTSDAQFFLGGGYNTSRTCAEHETWDVHGLRKSDPALSPNQLENVRRYLDATARVPGAQVKLMLICNMKENGRSMDAMEAWVRMVTKMIRVEDFKHVWISVANEPWHPQSPHLRDEGNVNRLIGAARAELGREYIITVDTNSSGPNDLRYNRAYNSDYPEFHPWRTDNRNPWTRLVPTGADVRRFIEENGSPVVFSEPIAYGAPEEPCCTTDEQVVINYKNAVERNGGIWFYHFRRGLDALELPGFLP